MNTRPHLSTAGRFHRLGAWIAAGLLSCSALMNAACAGAGGAPVPSAVTDPAYLREVARYLYRWHLDEKTVGDAVADGTFHLWIRRLDPPLDEGDRSEFAEIIVPQAGLAVRVKRADYRIEELGVDVTSSVFRIVNVARIEPPAAPPGDCVAVELPARETVDHLFRTRLESEHPDAALLDRMRLALIAHLERTGGALPAVVPSKNHLVYISPLSPVANEIWVFWETRHLLIRFASDIDLSNPLVWSQPSLTIRTYDIGRQVIVAQEEAPGSNAYMTRGQAGRALYNCIVYGRRIDVPVEVDLPQEPGGAGGVREP